MNVDTISSAQFFTLLSVLVSLFCYGTYFFSIYQKKTKPHVLSWFNWGLVTVIAAVAQFKLDGGFSVWVLIFIAAMCFFISFISLFVGEKNITKGDKITFIAALLTIPVWQITNSPFTAIILLIMIDSFSFYPTFRKSWNDPWGEPPVSYFFAGLRFFFLLFTVQNPTFQNMIYFAFLMFFDWVFVLYILYRRKVLK